MTENTGTVGTRTIASGLIIGSANIYGVWGSQVSCFLRTLYAFSPAVLRYIKPMTVLVSHLRPVAIAERESSCSMADFKTGNTINIVFAGTAVCLWIAQKFYYRHLNARHRRQWEALSERERRQVDEDRDKEGSKSVSFTFTT